MNARRPRADDGRLLNFVREALALDEKGRLVWGERPRDQFATARGWNRFNSQYAHCLVGPKFCLTVNGRKFSLLACRVRFALLHNRWPRHGEASDKGW
jgi:hypothetical protein